LCSEKREKRWCKARLGVMLHDCRGQRVSLGATKYYLSNRARKGKLTGARKRDMLSKHSG